MLEIKGRFKCMEIKEINNTKLLSIVNSDKDKDGKYINTYYQIWLNDKVSKMVNPDLKKKMANNAIIDIKGFLKVNKTNKYTCLTIYPKEITEFRKNEEW